LCSARGRGRDLADREAETPNLFRTGELPDPVEDLLLHELELMHPDRCGNPDEEHPPLQRVGMGLGGDLRTDGTPPGVEDAPVGRRMGDVPLLEDLPEDLPQHLGFYLPGPSAHGFVPFR